MKIFSKLLISAFLIIGATSSQAQLHKVMYNDNEKTLPNLLRYNTEGTPESAINGAVGKNLVYLGWNTSAETNTSHFELQRSENGKHFEPIETITASGISKYLTSYVTTDANYSACNDKLFYRLKIIFINGKENFTDTISLDINMTKTAVVYTLLDKGHRQQNNKF